GSFSLENTMQKVFVALVDAMKDGVVSIDEFVQILMLLFIDKEG
ncbi:TPA_asm: hypothetical protein, partial [ssRNA phage SRR7976357_4]